MKVNLFTLIIALIIGGLFGYGFYPMANPHWLAILGAVLCTLLLIATMSISLPEYPRSSVMFKTLSGSLFTVLLVTDIIFFWISVSMPVFVITNGLITAIGATGLHLIYKSKR